MLNKREFKFDIEVFPVIEIAIFDFNTGDKHGAREFWGDLINHVFEFSSLDKLKFEEDFLGDQSVYLLLDYFPFLFVIGVVEHEVLLFLF